MTKKRYDCKIYTCNALYFLEQMKESDDRADMVMTDPHSTYDVDFNLNWLKECYDVLKNNRILCSFCSPPTLDDFIRQAESVGFRHMQTFKRMNKKTGGIEPCMIMSKGRWRGKKLGILYDDCEGKPVSGFPAEAQKPVKLIKEFIKTFTKEGHLVIDFFIGSGTTPMACKELRRNFRGCEIVKDFSDVAKRRLGFKDMYATGQ